MQKTIISVKEAIDLISKKGTVIFDVRMPPEYERNHIEGASLVELSKLKRFPEQYLYGPENIIFVCERGIRSLAAANIAKEVGFKNVYSIDGGMIAWNEHAKQ